MSEIHPLIALRRSGRLIDPSRSIPDETLESLLEAARWAPSCMNNQPWRIVVSRADSLDRVKSCLSRGNGWALAAPLILTFTSTPGLGCQISGRDYYPLDLGLAIENLLLQGTHLGLVVHPIAGFDEAGVKSVLRIHDEYRIHALVVAGYPGTPETADPALLERERAPRVRKPLEEVVRWEMFS
ncbi:MAG TPA: nitroreductase [bacterium]|nr:nitroreductase [bacterium]